MSHGIPQAGYRSLGFSSLDRFPSFPHAGIVPMLSLVLYATRVEQRAVGTGTCLIVDPVCTGSAYLSLATVSIPSRPVYISKSYSIGMSVKRYGVDTCRPLSLCRPESGSPIPCNPARDAAPPWCFSLSIQSSWQAAGGGLVFRSKILRAALRLPLTQVVEPREPSCDPNKRGAVSAPLLTSGVAGTRERRVSGETVGKGEKMARSRNAPLR